MDVGILSIILLVTGVALAVIWRLLMHQALKVGDHLSLIAPAARQPDVVSAAVAMSYPAYRGRTYGGLNVGEHNFARKLLYWGDPCVDITYFCLQTLEQLTELDDDYDWRADFAQDRLDRIRSFVIAHYDGDGAFRHHQSSWGTLYATFCALETLKLMNRGLESAEQLTGILGGSWLERMARFIESSRSEDGGYAEAPYEAPTIPDTDAGVRLRQTWLGSDLDTTDIELIRSFVDSCTKHGPGGKGFSNSPSDIEPGTCASNYGLIIIENVVGKHALRQELPDADLHIDNLLASYDGSGFGFGPGHPAGVVYTDCALRALKRLLRQTELSRAKDVINPDEIANFLLSRERDGGFTDDDASPPSAHVTRSAVNCFKILGEWYGTDVTLPKPVSTRVAGFICSLFDERDGGFRGYKDAYVRALEVA